MWQLQLTLSGASDGGGRGGNNSYYVSPAKRKKGSTKDRYGTALAMGVTISASASVILFLCHFSCLDSLPDENLSYAQQCKGRSYGFDSVVCVCSEEYCDDVPPVGTMSTDSAKVYTSSRNGDRFRPSNVNWTIEKGATAADLRITLNPASQFQQILGFGGAFTDAAGINIASLSPPAQEQLLKQYFSSKGGIKYTVGRIPMASCDFSTHEYSYDDVKGDLKLESFKLAPEDVKYKIPYIQRAETLSGYKLKLFGSPWSAPGWMKTSGKMNGNGTLKGKPGGKYYNAWAQYFIKFIQSYRSHNISVWGLTGQNEPTTGYVYNYTFQTMGFTPETQRDFIKLSLGPALASSGFQDVKLMILDDQRLMLPQWAKIVLGDPIVRKMVWGVGVHWYYDNMVPPKVLDVTHQLFPVASILGTEACTGALGPRRGPALGDWMRAESYAADIIQDLNHWVVGWTDWNLALSENGGPNWVKNFVDSPIIVNKTGNEFYKQPMFYALGHFSAFIDPGAVRLGVKVEGSSPAVSVLGVRNPEGRRVVVVLNTGVDEKRVSVSEVAKRHAALNLAVKPHSITTVLWDKPLQ